MAAENYAIFKIMKQLVLQPRTWGGRRQGAGRPRKKENRRVSHLTRPALAPRFPVHATWRMHPDVWNLRSRRAWKALAPALWAGAEREGFRLVHFAIMGNHIHLLVEASDRVRLARGMQGLGVRVARRLNRMMRERSGRVVGDRYHAHILKTPSEVKRARTYLLTNDVKHYGRRDERYVSLQPLALPHTWLMRQHC
jgi:REP element-mobilizing transposase RayT